MPFFLEIDFMKHSFFLLIILFLYQPLFAAEIETYINEDRMPCEVYVKNKIPLFGDLHVHTKYSFDSYLSGQRNGPDSAYRYAKGDTKY